MARLVLMRHAEAQKAPGQFDEDLYSLGDLPLSARGREQAIAAAAQLAGHPFDAVHASPALRAQETARLVAGDRPVTLDARLLELSLRGATGTYEDVQARIRDFARALKAGEDPLLPDGERYQAHKRRFVEAVEEIAARHESCLIVAHGIANRVFLAHALQMPDAALFRLDQAHACVNELESTPRGWILQRMG